MAKDNGYDVRVAVTVFPREDGRVKFGESVERFINLQGFSSVRGIRSVGFNIGGMTADALQDIAEQLEPEKEPEGEDEQG